MIFLNVIMLVSLRVSIMVTRSPMDLVGDSSRLSSGFSRLLFLLRVIFMGRGNTIPKSAMSMRAFIRTAIFLLEAKRTFVFRKFMNWMKLRLKTSRFTTAPM